MCAENIDTIDNASSGKAPAREGELGPLARFKYELVRGFLWGWARCFSLRGLYLLGAGFAVCEWLINYKRRRRFRQHLKTGFGRGTRVIEKTTARRACLQHFIRTRCDKLFYLIFDKLPKEKILSRVRFPREADFAEEVARGKGMYVCLSHVGSHHVLALIMALKGYRVAGVRDPNEGTLRRYIQRKYEETFPEFRAIRLLYSNMYPRDVYRCFQEGYILGSTLDIGHERGAHLRMVTVEMFGKKRDFLAGPVQIALRCKAPIYQGFVVSRPNFCFDLVLKGPLIESEDAADTPETLKTIIQRYADNIADHLAEYPDHISRT
jgi:lauroyl/myristoyl acyltransferase